MPGDVRDCGPERVDILMEGLRDSLGSDSRNPGKVIGITIFLLLLASFSWITSNATLEAKATAEFYINLGMIFVGVFVIDAIFVKGMGRKMRDADIPDTMTYEEQSPLGFKLPGFAKILLVTGSLLLAGYIFVSVGAQPTMSIVSAPTFQLIDIGTTGSAFLSGSVGIVEDLFFFGFLGPTIFSLLFFFTGKKILALGAAWVAAPVIFMLYHLGRYGASSAALDSVLVFGFVSMTLAIFLGNLLPVHAIHFGNNAGLAFFARTATDVSGLFWIYVFLVLLATFGYYMIRRRGG